MVSKNRGKTLSIGIVGAGIAGMSAAWLLSKRHEVTVFEKDGRIGGHANTVDVNGIGVDTGFIVYNVKNYPNLIALFNHLGVSTRPTEMSFGVSVGAGDFEYAGSNLLGLIAQKRNLIRPRFWAMARDILRFYREAPEAPGKPKSERLTLGQYLTTRRYSEAFVRDHLLPMGAAIWSTPVDVMLDYPLDAFIRFCDNHGLLRISNRPQWRTVVGGSREYVKRLTAPYSDAIHPNSEISKVWSDAAGAHVAVRGGTVHRFDQVVLASHADQTLKMLDRPEAGEQRLLGTFKYQRNKAILHTDSSLMPVNRKVWSSWNYLSETRDDKNAVCVTYWMNKLQSLPGDRSFFVTLNPVHTPREHGIVRNFTYHHPIFDNDAVAAQRMLWNIQGRRGIWFCGSYFGHGFHEDALQSGLAVAEALGGVKRPWSVARESGRINLPEDWPSPPARDAA